MIIAAEFPGGLVETVRHQPMAGRRILFYQRKDCFRLELKPALKRGQSFTILRIDCCQRSNQVDALA